MSYITARRRSRERDASRTIVDSFNVKVDTDGTVWLSISPTNSRLHALLNCGHRDSISGRAFLDFDAQRRREGGS